jgi:hypothetical protein
MMRWFYYGVRNLWRWFPVIWRDRDWDHMWLAAIVAHKLRLMADMHENHGCLAKADVTAAQLRHAAWLLEHYDDENDAHAIRYTTEFARLWRRHFLTWWD